VVNTASDGPKTIELANSDRPEVILLDMLLPGMSGLDVLMALKKDSGKVGIPVVAFTGLGEQGGLSGVYVTSARHTPGMGQ
jgi:CheY-like chemotaxis protein